MPRRKGLGAPSKKHAALATTFISNAEIQLKHLGKPATCRVRFDYVREAVESVAKAWSHGFGSGGRVHKGALTPRTISEADAKRLYDVDHKVTVAAQKFRSECLKDE